MANIFSSASAPFAAEAERIDAEVRAAPVIASDETSAHVEGQTCWQWVFGSATAVAHRIAVSRGKAVVNGFLEGAKPEVWVSDSPGAQTNHAQGASSLPCPPLAGYPLRHRGRRQTVRARHIS
ncbi:MAG: transposase [Rhodomicrobium sp.]